MKRLLLFSIVGLTIFASCKKDEDETISKIEIAEGESIQMLYGEKVQLHANRYPENIVESIKDWTSSNPNIASVNALGEVTAKGKGEATVTITTINGFSASCLIIVNTIDIEEIEFDSSKITLTVEETKKINPTVLPDSASFINQIVYTSSDETIAKVEQDGTVKAIKPGTCQIKAASPDGKIEDTYNLVVQYRPITSINLKNLSCILSIEVGKSYQFEVAIDPSVWTDKTIKWVSSDASIATVNEDGTITGVAVGECTITASSATNPEAKIECKVTVVAAAAE